MQNIFNSLERRGFVSEEDAGKIETLTSKLTFALYEEIYAAVFDSQINRHTPPGKISGDLDPFTFYAGASVRGDVGCGEQLCRSNKLDFLGRYAALYANEVTVPLPLQYPDHVKDVGRAKYLLYLSAITLLQLRPLISYGIVKPAIMRTQHCVHTIAWANRLIDLIHELADDAAKRSLEDFSIVYQIPDKAPTGRSTAYVEGPREFLEHGSAIMLFDEGPRWRLMTWKYDGDGKTALRGKKKLCFVQDIFNQIAHSTSFYLAAGRLQNARLLTDLPGEASFLEWLTGDENLKATTSSMEYLRHAVPILNDIPLATLVRIRREERDSFETYRTAVTRISTDVLNRKRKLSKRDAKEMLKTLIEPEIFRLRKEIRYERRRQAKRVAGGLAAFAAGIGIGVYGGLPAALGSVLVGAGAITGGRLLGKAAEAACEHGANLRQKNDLYFLIRLIERGTA